MAPQQGRRRARIAFSDSAAKQLENITSESEIHALDRALVVISVDPDVGEPIPGDTTGPQLRQYAGRYVHGVLGAKKDTDALGAYELDNRFYLLQQRIAGFLENKMGLVNKNDKLGFVKIAFFRHSGI